MTKRQILFTLITIAAANPRVHAQAIPQYLGLAGDDLTSLSVYGLVVAAGTDGSGVFFQADTDPTPAGWKRLDLDSLTVQSVYAHKSGPIGWAIAAGVARPDGSRKDTTALIYCSHLGQPFIAGAHGIDSTATRVVALTGFPDPTICGETYAAVDQTVYVRPFGDTTWTPTFSASAEGSLSTVVARPEYPGVVVAGGADGFAGHLLVRSADFGKTWTDISPVQPITAVDFGGKNAETIFAGSYGSLHRSTDAGETWDAPIVDGNATVYAHIAYASTASAVYAAVSQPGTPAQIRYSLDDGDTWRVYDPGVSSEIVGMQFGEGTRWLYYATAADGLFRIERTSISVGVEELAESGEGSAGSPTLDPAYPNPFSRHTTVSYRTSGGIVNITIQDVLGRVVARWTRSHPAAATSTVEWAPRGVADGLYVVSVQSDGGRTTTTVVKGN